MKRLTAGSTVKDHSSGAVFTLRAVLGRGAASTVFRTDEGVALKIVERSKASTSDDDLEAARHEAALLTSMRDDAAQANVVALHSWFDDNDGRRVCLVFELFEHGSVAKRLRLNGALTERSAAGVVRQVLVALGFLHARGVIHRDVKAANVLVDSDTGRCVLADLGVAARASSSSAVVVGAPVGTAHWLAPEVITTQLAVAVSDIWSLGCMTVELFTTKPPYALLDAMAAMFRVVHDETPPLPAHCTPVATAFLRRCFARNVDERPPAVTLLADAWLDNAERAALVHAL
jgi:serine/threonine protein kinase